MSSNEKLIVLDDVCKHFKVSGGMLKAVDHISLDIYKGETLGLVGESGCGKSTLGRVAMGIYPATSGKLYYAGEELNLKNAATRFKYAKKSADHFPGSIFFPFSKTAGWRDHRRSCKRA